MYLSLYSQNRYFSQFSNILILVNAYRNSLDFFDIFSAFFFLFVLDRIQNFNENYLGEVGIKADEAVRCICTIYDDTGHIDDYRVTVYQYKGKWYSHSADAFFE